MVFYVAINNNIGDLSKMDFLKDNQKEIIIGIVTGLIVAAILWLIEKSQNISPIQVPFWVVIGIFIIPLAIFLVSRKSKKLKKVANENFGVERVFIDGKHFTDCKFDGTELVFKALEKVNMGHCQLSNSRFKFEGAASLTMELLTAFYGDPGLRPIAKAAIDNIIHRGTQIESSRSVKG